MCRSRGGACGWRATRVVRLANYRPGAVIVASNEVMSGIDPSDQLSRRYREKPRRASIIFVADEE